MVASELENIPNPAAKGRFIVFEGADRSGKTTQTRRITEALRVAGFKVAEHCPWRFPDRTTKVGKLIDSYLKDNEDLDDNVLHLLFSANRWEKVNELNAALDNGKTVIVDRYAFSGVAYSAAKGINDDWCKGADAGLPAPDLVVYLDLPYEAAVIRGAFGAERYEREAMQRAVAVQFRKLHNERWRIVDADAEEDEVYARVMHIVKEFMLAEMPSRGTLWSGGHSI